MISCIAAPYTIENEPDENRLSNPRGAVDPKYLAVHVSQPFLVNVISQKPSAGTVVRIRQIRHDLSLVIALFTEGSYDISPSILIDWMILVRHVKVQWISSCSR